VRPELERQGLLNGLGWPDRAGRRPADTLLCSSAGLLRGASRHSKVALDFAYVNPQNLSHLNAAANTRLAAASAYSDTKRKHLDTARQCEAAGILFQPMVFETLGGASQECMDVLNNLSRQVAVNTKTPYEEVAHRLRQRISVDLQRANHRAFARRTGFKLAGASTHASRIINLNSLLESPEGA
jgi:hypothetical protein